MKKVTSALALAALVGTPAAAMANVEFGGDFDAGYYNTQGAGDRMTGFEQRIRLQSTFETDGGVSVNTRLNLTTARWTGDGGGGVQGDVERPFSDDDHRNVELDYGYASVPLAGGMVNVGRMISNWNHGLTATDDRRDQVNYVRPLGGGHTAIAGYQLRVDGGATTPENSGSQYFGALLGPLAEGVQYGVLAAHYDAAGSGAGDVDGYNIRGAQLLAPYIMGQAGDFGYTVGAHYLGNSRGTAFTEDTIAGFVKGDFQLSPEFKMEGQVLHAMDGALVAGGYDSYSSLIHNSPDHDNSATRIAALNLGGGGVEAQDGISRTLVATRGTFEMMDWTFMGAVGYVDYDNDGAGDNEVLFLDAQAHYQLTPSTTVYATTGYADLDEDMGGRDNFFASSVNLNVQF